MLTVSSAMSMPRKPPPSRRPGVARRVKGDPSRRMAIVISSAGRFEIAAFKSAVNVMGSALMQLGALSQARSEFEKIIALYDPQRDRSLAARYITDPRASGLVGMPAARHQQLIDFGDVAAHPAG